MGVVEREIDRTELYVADEAFFCGSGYEITPIVSIDRFPLGDGKVGPITQRLTRAYMTSCAASTAGSGVADADLSPREGLARPSK